MLLRDILNMIFVKFKKGKQKEFILKALKIASSERKLEKLTGIPKSSIYEYKNEHWNMPLVRVKKLTKLISKEFSDILGDVEKLLPSNWGRKKGGKKRINLSKSKGEFEKVKQNLRIALKNWHTRMRLNQTEKYYKMQYEKFKIMRLYKFKTLRGEIVRNQLEMRVANILFRNGIDYEYEPFILIEGHRYFPDFKIKDVIIECTAWDKEDKALELNEKINNYKKAGFRIFCVIPPKLKRLYKVINNFIIRAEDLPEIISCPGSSNFLSNKA